MEKEMPNVKQYSLNSRDKSIT